MRSVQPHVHSCKQIDVNPKADLMDDELSPLKDDPLFKQAWERRKWRRKDKSASAYLSFIAEHAIHAGWKEDQKICDLLIKWQRKHDEAICDPEYYAAIIAKVRADDARAQLLSSVKADKKLPREEALQMLSTLLTVHITSIQRYDTDPRSYVMRLGNGSYIEFSASSEMTSQKKLSGALFDYANAVMPTFNNAEWKNVAQCIVDCIEEVESSFESTHLGAAISYVRAYLRRHLRPDNEREGQIMAALQGKPALIDGAIWFSMEGLRRSIMLESSEHPPAKGVLSIRLKQIGCEYDERKELSIKSYHTSRSLWRAPDDFVEESINASQSLQI